MSPSPDMPRAPIEFLDWPDPPVTLPLSLSRLAGEREAQLRPMLPERGPTAWDTAKELLRWVARQWDHDNEHVEHHDAVSILEQAATGARFACDEYAVVLAQSLNAMRIPARWIGLRRENYHWGVSAAHSAVEAWIDDLSRWVVLDAQNAAYWADDHDRPLSVLELQHHYRNEHSPRPRMIGCDDADFWWQYFATASTTGSTADLRWSTGPFSPIFQERFMVSTERLFRDPTPAYPDLAGAWIGTCGTREHPELRLGTQHPYAEGFSIIDSGTRAVVDSQWPLNLSAGKHRAAISVVTPYTELPAGHLSYQVN